MLCVVNLLDLIHELWHEFEYTLSNSVTTRSECNAFRHTISSISTVHAVSIKFKHGGRIINIVVSVYGFFYDEHERFSTLNHVNGQRAS